VDVDISEWGTVYNSNLLRIQASPSKQQLLITVKQQNALDDHTHMVKTLLDALLRANITSLNVDHVRWAGKQRTLPLDFENVRVDFNIHYKEQQILLEVKTHDTVLADRTRAQLTTLTRHRQYIGLVVPDEMLKKADMMLKLTRNFRVSNSQTQGEASIPARASTQSFFILQPRPVHPCFRASLG